MLLLMGIAIMPLLLQAAALGTDLKPSVPSRPVLVPFTSWSGPYLFGLGDRFNAVDANVTSASIGTPAVAIAVPAVSPRSGNKLAFWQQQQSAMQYLDNIALRGGVYGGWNVQVGRLLWSG
jgi:hypothetical protein